MEDKNLPKLDFSDMTMERVSDAIVLLQETLKYMNQAGASFVCLDMRDTARNMGGPYRATAIDIRNRIMRAITPYEVLSDWLSGGEAYSVIENIDKATLREARVRWVNEMISDLETVKPDPTPDVGLPVIPIEWQYYRDGNAFYALQDAYCGIASGRDVYVCHALERFAKQREGFSTYREISTILQNQIRTSLEGYLALDTFLLVKRGVLHNQVMDTEFMRRQRMKWITDTMIRLDARCAGGV